MRPPACLGNVARALTLLLSAAIVADGLSATVVAQAQMPGGPPSVGVVRVQQTAITETRNSSAACRRSTASR